jgi:hypothetical protein
MRNAQRQIRSVKNNRAALSETAEQDCDNQQGGTVKNNRATYIKKIPKENTNLETTTTCNSDFNNQNGSGAEGTEASSSHRFLDGDKSSEWQRSLKPPDTESGEPSTTLSFPV